VELAGQVAGLVQLEVMEEMETDHGILAQEAVLQVGQLLADHL
jgi:hypothetical protein